MSVAAAAVVTKDWDSVKVFSVTKMQDRDKLGETITNWLKEHKVAPVETVVTQSSDSEFHCLTITVFYKK